MAITKNIFTDYGADNTGVADVTPKFNVSLNADMQGQDVNLTIPIGTYNFATFATPGWIDGALDINVIATGATLTSSGTGGVFLQTKHLTQAGIDSASGKSARIQTANIGATSATLTAASASAGHISRFIVGNWMMVAGWDIQGSFQSGYSFPPNFQWSEFVKITSIVGNTIFFTGHPLRNFYDANWPETNRGTNFQIDSAGPASIFALDPAWGGTSTFNDGTYNNGQLINCYRENFIMNGGTSASQPIYSSVNKLFRAVNHTAVNALTEVDKISDTVEYTGGTYNQFKAQSPGARIFTASGVTVGAFDGTAKNTVIDNCVVSGGLRVGPIAYGIGDRIAVSNSAISGAVTGGLIDDGPTHGGWNGVLRMSGGIITVPRSAGTTLNRVMVPDTAGRNVTFWMGDSGYIGSFKPLSVTSDPWPAVDDQTATTNITSANGSQTITVSANLFTSGDVNKVIAIPGALDIGGPGTLYTFITGVSAFSGGAQNITVYNPATRDQSAVSGTVQWGTCNYYVQTDQAGSYPGSGLYGTRLRVGSPPVKYAYFTNNTGHADIVDLCNPGAYGKPLWSYTKRPYAQTNGPSIPMVGNLVSIKVNVTTTYKGASSLQANFGAFNNVPCIIGGALSTFGPSINLKVLGERIINIGSSSGIQTGDSGTTLSSPIWLVNTFDISLSRNISAESSSDWPAYTVEMITDQGIPAEVPAAVAPLRLRLRAA